MKKRIAAGLLALTIVLGGAGLLPQGITDGAALINVSAEDINGFEYAENDGMVQITRYTGSDAEVVIPAEIDGMPVVRIAGYAFENCTGITGITVPEGVQSLGDSAFQGCTSLTSVTLPESLSYIGEWAFLSCISLKDITLPDNVWYIGMKAFDGCSSLTSINVPKKLSTLGRGAFSFCRSLTGITVPAENGLFKSVDGVLYNGSGDELICCPGGKKTVDIAESVRTIPADALKGNPAVTEVKLHEGLETIGNYAFYDCRNLRSLTVPKSVTGIGSKAIGFWYDTDQLAMKPVEGFVIYCYNLSAAVDYAEKNGIDYVLLDRLSVLAEINVHGDADPSEAVVTVTDDKGVTYPAEVTSDGVLALTDLPDGRYTIETALKGYAPVVYVVEVTENGSAGFTADLYLYGDVNTDGAADMIDYALLQRSLSNWDAEINKKAADLSGDGFVDMVDYALLQRLLSGWDIWS